MLTTPADLYERDFALWVQAQINATATGEYQQLDVAHILEELTGLVNKDKREIEKRLTTAFTHTMKLEAMPHDDAVRGWSITVQRTTIALARIIKQSPSLMNYLTDENVLRETFADALLEFNLQYGEHEKADNFVLFSSRILIAVGFRLNK